MTIFILPISYPDAQHPTSSIFVYEQVRALAMQGHKIVVLHAQKQPTRHFLKPISRRIQTIDDGFATRYMLKTHTFLESKLTALNGWNFARKTMRLYKCAAAREGKPDVLYSHFSVNAGYAGMKIAKKFKIPHMVMEHNGAIVRGGLSKAYKKMLQCTAQSADLFACVSQNLKNKVATCLRTPKDIQVIPNMVDDAFAYMPPVEKDYMRFFALGNLYSGKRFDLLINAFVRAFAPDENVKLYISGKGEKYEMLRRMICEAGREDQIILLGAQTRSEILEQFRLCDSFVLPSAFETFGMVWREAMAVGRPIITTDHGGFDVWDDQWGVKIPVDDLEALVDAMITMKDTYQTYDGSYISAGCRSLYGRETIITTVEESLKKAILLQK